MSDTVFICNTSPLQYFHQLENAGLVAEVTPLLARLQALGFRLRATTRCDVLDLAGETP